jgi:metal-dependent amidase/aminoacylase/carboxypeptidase family protein
LWVRLYGRGGHGSRPTSTIDPIVLAASIVIRLQTIVAREVPIDEKAVVTVGTLHAGTKDNIIPDEAELGLAIRTFSDPIRARVMASVERISRGRRQRGGAGAGYRLVAQPACADLRPRRDEQAMAAGRFDQDVPYNHSPRFAPVSEPTIATGVEALATAALNWLKS